MSGRRMTRLRALSQQLETLRDSGSNTVGNCGIASEVSLTQGEMSGSARTNGFDRESTDGRRPTRLRSRATSSRLNSGIQRNHRTLRSNAASTSTARVIGVAPLNPIEEALQTNGDETFVGVAWGEEPIPMAISDNDEEQTGESVMEISSNSSVEGVETTAEILPNTIQAAATNDLTQLRDLPSPNGGRPNVDRLLPQAPSLVENSQADFQLPSHSSVKKKSPDKKLDETVDESEFCTICYEQWTTAGKHRLVCLKCGHLFGKECIEKWLDSQMKSTCPQCNAKASKKDIRCIYVRKLMAVDNTEVERLKKELEEERVARRRMELDLGLMVFKWQQTEDNCNVLKKELAAQRELTQATVRQAAIDSVTQDPSHGKSGRYEIEKTFTVDVGGCRALAYNSEKMYLCASQASSSPLYPGFGVRKLSTVDLKTFQYVPMHSKQIRDLSFHPTLNTSLLLSCAVDKTVKITSMDSLEVVQSFTCSSPVWSCTWSRDNLKHFFIGTQSGEVLLFDIRDTREHVASLLPQAQNPKSIVSLRYVPRFIQNSPGPGGLLVGQLDRSLFLEQNNNNDTFVTHFLSNDSVLMSLYREETTGHVLASYRPTQQNPTVRHEVNNLVLTQKPPGSVASFLASSSSSYYERVAYDRVRTFNGGTSQQTLTRTALIPHPELGAEQLFVCAGDGNNAALNLWNVSTGSHHQRLVGPDQGVTDVCSIGCEEGSSRFLSAVGNRQIFIYRWRTL